MANKDGRELARANEARVLKSLLKFGWLRTRDIAALHWVKTRARQAEGFSIDAITVEASAMRMAQRTHGLGCDGTTRCYPRKPWTEA